MATPTYTPRLAAPVFTRDRYLPVAAPVHLPGSDLPRPQLDYDVRRGVWVLTRAYQLAHAGSRLTIPARYTLDLASVPRVLWWLISSFELGLIGPLVHDFLYQCRGEPGADCEPPRAFSRAEVDRLFLEVMEREGVPRVRRRVAYTAVRLVGAHAWRVRV